MNAQAPELLRVLVPVDFSETSRRALAWAFDYARRAPCELHIVHVVEDHLTDLLPQGGKERLESEISSITAAAAEELERMVPDAQERECIGPIHRHVVRGRPAAEILRTIDRIGAEMVVMGTHGRTGLANLLIGSVAEKIVRHAHCPVVCVKPGRASEVGA
ncbi:MAG: universal stress protein [Deltaproteobacteria bacterium]|nr:universal stress protein [Deltaproteobacteria bacterium]